MFAIVGAVFSALGLLCDWLNVGSDFLNYPTLDTLGLLCVALHLAGFGTSYDWRSRGRAMRGRSRRR